MEEWGVEWYWALCIFGLDMNSFSDSLTYVVDFDPEIFWLQMQLLKEQHFMCSSNVV